MNSPDPDKRPSLAPEPARAEGRASRAFVSLFFGDPDGNVCELNAQLLELLFKLAVCQEAIVRSLQPPERIAALGRGLLAAGFTLLSTGGTARAAPAAFTGRMSFDSSARLPRLARPGPGTR